MHYALLILFWATPNGGFMASDLTTQMTFANAADCAGAQRAAAGRFDRKAGYRGVVNCVALHDGAALKPVAFGPVQIASRNG